MHNYSYLIFHILAQMQSNNDVNSFWLMFTAISTFIAVVVSVCALWYASKTWDLERLPIVHAVGTFIISTKDARTNELRDRTMFQKDSPHTFQLINVGRGPAKNVIPSVRRNIVGKFLEDINTNSFSLPANSGTKELREVLRVHGQRFVYKDTYELEFEDDRKTGYFYVRFQDSTGKLYLTKTRIKRVGQADGEYFSLVNTPGIEMWKVVDNIEIKDGLPQG